MSVDEPRLVLSRLNFFVVVIWTSFVFNSVLTYGLPVTHAPTAAHLIGVGDYGQLNMPDDLNQVTPDPPSTLSVNPSSEPSLGHSPTQGSEESDYKTASTSASVASKVVGAIRRSKYRNGCDDMLVVKGARARIWRIFQRYRRFHNLTNKYSMNSQRQYLIKLAKKASPKSVSYLLKLKDRHVKHKVQLVNQVLKNYIDLPRYTLDKCASQKVTEEIAELLGKRATRPTRPDTIRKPILLKPIEYGSPDNELMTPAKRLQHERLIEEFSGYSVG